MSFSQLSVIIPAFNASATISEGVRSAFQAGAAEVVVVDDGSTDGTASLAHDAGATVVSQANSGAAAARRNGLEKADEKSTAIIFLDSDDSLISAGVRSAVVMIDAGGFAAVCGRTVGIHADGSETMLKTWSVPITTGSLLERGYGPCPPASVVWSAPILRRAMSDEIAAVWPRYAEDYELIIRGSLLGSIASSEEPTSRYRMTGGKSAQAPIRSVRDAEAIREHYAGISGLPVALRGPRSQKALALIRTASGEPRGSLRRSTLLMKSVFTHPPTPVSFAAQSLGQRR
jgi:hypothetical protein